MCCRQLVLWAAVWLSATALSAQAPETQKVRINTPYVPTPPEVADLLQGRFERWRTGATANTDESSPKPFPVGV